MALKPSHFTTPRTLDDATFQTWGQAIHGGPNHAAWRVADRVAIVMLSACSRGSASLGERVMVIDTQRLSGHECRGPLAAEACTEIGVEGPRDRARDYRRLIAISVAAWLVPVAVMAVAVWVLG